MLTQNESMPRAYWGVTISSTFKDLADHRAALIKIIKGHGLTDVAMENDAAKPNLDVIDSSLQMVCDGSAYVGVVGQKYGQVPVCPTRNPKKLSITELEFNEAQRLNRPVLLLIMSDEHPVRGSDVETNTAKRRKLRLFRERAKQMVPGSAVHRVYATFKSLDEFKEKAAQSISELRRYLDGQALPSLGPSQPVEATRATAHGSNENLPVPPAFYAEPEYIGSHEFVGREAEMITLDDWALSADPYPILLFEAIGGTGKSMITWEWVTKRSTAVRDDWAGRFWYSFYERGAEMSDFCRRAMAYLTRRPLADFEAQKTARLARLLVAKLKECPCLLVLDGLERVLVAYHRFDAAQLADNEAGAPDQIAARDPCAAIRPEDDDLLRALATAAPSKVLITTRLTPRTLLNQSGQAVPGVLRRPLSGLRSADAETLFRACGVRGDSQDMQNYLKSRCDCHPLVTGVLAGLINNYLPDRGNFDAWLRDPEAGGHANLGVIDLVQTRNHILRAALAALPSGTSQVLATLALLSEAVDFATLSALNPLLPPRSEEVPLPTNPETWSEWRKLSRNEMDALREREESALPARKEFERAYEHWQESPAHAEAGQKLNDAVVDLERRGLLQYDAQAKRYDLHPVVRAVAVERLSREEKERYGRHVVDYFSQEVHLPFREAETLDDVRAGVHVVRTLLHMGRYKQAHDVLRGELMNALFSNLEADTQVLSLLQPFFSRGWGAPPTGFERPTDGYLPNAAGMALENTGASQEALEAYGVAVLSDLRGQDWLNVRIDLCNIASALFNRNRLAKTERCVGLSLALATLRNTGASLFNARLFQFWFLAELGKFDEAEATWNAIHGMKQEWAPDSFPSGFAERVYAEYRFFRGDLCEEHLAHAEEAARRGRNRISTRLILGLRGEWLMENRKWSLAAEALGEAVRMAREVGQTDPGAETRLTLAKFHLKQLPDIRHEAEELSNSRHVSHRALAELWFAIGDPDKAKTHALAAYKWAWSDGEPYVRRHPLERMRALLKRLHEDLPELSPYDSAKDGVLPWEEEVAAAIEKLRIARTTTSRTEPRRRLPAKGQRKR